MDKQKKNLGAAAFLPLIVFLACYVGCGITFTLMGVTEPFGKFPRHVALLAGCAVALLLNRKMNVADKLNIMTTNMGNSGVMMIVLIYLMAGGFQGAAAAMGGKDSVVNLCLHFIPVKLLVPGVFLMCCFISTSIGTSMGTIAAMAPIAINVAQGAHLNVAVVGAAVIGGSYFGDNLSMISDTTISAAEGCGSEMKDKFKMNFFIALPAAIVAIILYSIFGGVGSGAIEAGSYNIIEVLPYFIVLIAALMGVNVAVVLFVGILASGIIGLCVGSCGFFEWIQAIGSGMSDMFSISIVAILVSGIICRVIQLHLFICKSQCHLHILGLHFTEVTNIADFVVKALPVKNLYNCVNSVRLVLLYLKIKFQLSTPPSTNLRIILSKSSYHLYLSSYIKTCPNIGYSSSDNSISLISF